MKFETVEQEREYLCGLKEGERVIETGSSMMTGWQGTTVMGSRGMCVKWDNRIEGGQLTTAVTHGTRRIQKLIDVLKHDSEEAWPLVDVLSKLTEAAELFLGSYNYDGHGHEELIVCVERAKTILADVQAERKGE